MKNFTTFFTENSRIHNYLSRKFMVFAILITFSTNGFASSGLFDAYAIFSINSGANTYRQYTAIPNWSIGSFTYGSSSLILNGAQIKTFKNGGSNVTGGQIAYRVYLTSAGSAGVPFSFIQLGFGENYVTNGDQRWEKNNENVNLLTGRNVGTYTFEAYFQAYTSDGDSFYSNSGSNYKASFTITAATATVTPTIGQSKVFGAADPTFIFSTSPTVTTSGALSRAAGENVATSPYAYSIGTLASTNVNYTLSLAAGTFAITKATPTATLAVSNSPVAFTNAAQSATVGITVSSIAGTVSSVLTGGLAVQTAAATYGVTASFVPNDTANYNTLTGLSAGNFVISSSTIWNGASWNLGAPTALLDAVVDGTLTTSGALTAKSITVNATRTLTIATGTNVTVQNEVLNDGTLVVENNANLIQVNPVFNSGVGTTIVNRTGNFLTRNEYTIWSSPVFGQNLLAFSPVTLPTRFYNYNESTNLYNEVAGVASTSFSQGAGYLIRMPDSNALANYNTGGASMNYLGAFTGTLNNGDIPKLMEYSGPTKGYNMVGNPYPSAIDANAFISANTTNIESTLYFWRKVNGAQGTAYASYNSLGPVAAGSGISGTGSEAPNGTIQVGQGFFVKAKSATSLIFTNAMRVGNNANQFFKTKQVAQKDRVWLNLTNTSGLFSQALVGYTADATVGIDIYDGKYINDSPIALTSSINNEEYTIQGRPAFDATDVVALNFKTDATGDYTIAIDHVDGLFSGGQDIYLVDTKTGAETNLKTGSYTFTATAGVDNSRFSLKYQKTLGVDAQALNDNNVVVYKNNGVIYVNSGAKIINSIKVFDIQGRVLAERNNVKANTTSIQNLNASNQIVIVKVTTVDNQVISKKVEN